MSVRHTQEDIINNFKLTHGDRFDYSKVKYINIDTKVCVICKEHGEFFISPYSHIKGTVCNKCWQERRKSGELKGRKAPWVKPSSKEEFVAKAIAIHGDKYTYDKVEYKRSREKVCITCPIHGDFYQSPNHLIKDGGCILCKKDIVKATPTKSSVSFKERVKSIHGDKLILDKTNYLRSTIDVTVTCPIHGDFNIKPKALLNKVACKKCLKRVVKIDTLKNKDKFLKKASQRYGDRFDYSSVNFVDSRTKITIRCREHGDFSIVPNNHLTGQGGCRKCYVSFNRDNWCFKMQTDVIAKIYLVLFEKDAEIFVKIGITIAVSTKKRFSSLRTSGGYSIKELFLYESPDREFLWDLEADVKRLFLFASYTPKIRFGGASTECFDHDYKDSILLFLKEKVKQHKQ